jgi:single-stranded DNA-specific DHH superfamily exonuclease
VKRIFMTRSLSQLRLWGRALSYIKEEPRFKFAWSALTKADFVAAQASSEDTTGVVDELLKTAEGMDFVILMYEREGGIKVSLRATLPHVDVSAIALHMGGGGHTQAAAFFLPEATIAQNEQGLIGKIRSFLEHRQPAGTPEAPLNLPEDVAEPASPEEESPAKSQPRRPQRATRPSPFKRETPAQDAQDLESEENLR